jgi:hypothetical protein
LSFALVSFYAILMVKEKHAMPYAAAIEALAKEIGSDRAALAEKERVLRGLKAIQAQKQTPGGAVVIDSRTPQLPLVAPMPVAKTLLEATREVITALRGQEFSVPTVQELLPTVGFQLGGKYPRARLSTTLETLSKGGEIERTYTGKGNVPHRYKAKEGGPLA